MNKKTVAVIAAGAMLALALPASATPGSGVSGTVVARGTAVEKVKTRGNAPYDVVVQNLTIAPGGHTGWHTHPGIAVAVVKAGTLTIYESDDESCTGHDYTAGEVYVDPGYGHVHLGRNVSSDVTLEIAVTYLDVPVGEAVRIDAADPGNCSF
ncbi:cupin domain-containing protein [Intrasporangium sp. DVR]|uniref:cupin domain-containing protein n=1 Tax=Intrasporangium sp. DVR TaxID=3127867 RepID=UPI00313A6184